MDRVIILTKRIENDLSADFSSILKYSNQGELQQFIHQFDKDESMKHAYIYHHNANELLQHFRACFKNLPRTFHTYKIKDQSIVKETHWFEMVYHGDNTPQPQVEENIESVFWVRPHEITPPHGQYLSLDNRSA